MSGLPENPQDIDKLYRDLRTEREKFNAHIDAALNGSTGGLSLFTAAEASREATRILKEIVVASGLAERGDE